MPEIAIATEAKQDEILNKLSEGIGTDYHQYTPGFSFRWGHNIKSKVEPIIFNILGKGIVTNLRIVVGFSNKILTIIVDDEVIYFGDIKEISNGNSNQVEIPLFFPFSSSFVVKLLNNDSTDSSASYHCSYLLG